MNIEPLNKAINAFLERDPHNLLQLAPLAGCRLQCRLTQPAFVVTASFTETSITLSLAPCDTADASFTGSASAFLSYLKGGMQHAALIKSGITVEGDSEVLLHLNDWLRTLDLDWEGVLADFTNDHVAGMLGYHAKKAFSWIKERKSSLKTTISDYITEEARILPSREEVNDFYDTLKQTQFAVDRVQARMVALKSKDEKDC